MAFAPTDTLFDTVLDFLASTPTPEQIIAYQPPEPLQQRLSTLLEQNRSDGLGTIERKAEISAIPNRRQRRHA